MKKQAKPAQSTVKKGSQVITKVGGSKGFSLVWDTIDMPSRGAKLSTRLKWASGYLQRFLDGETATRRNLALVVKWTAEAAGDVVRQEHLAAL